ncbi:MAG: tetratricopeptide repeat protein [Planctomycetes bacterium]|nr:tetratricopeptide repeat protein [Planctomycetota bacterium]
MKKTLFSCLTVFCLLVLVPWAAADTVEMLDGSKKTKVQVVEENLQKVVYKKPGLPNQSVLSDKVRDVKFYTSANEFKTAQEVFKTNDWGTAADLFKEYGESLESDKEALKAHCMYQVCQCYQKAGMWDDAIAAINDFTKRYPDHRLYPKVIKDRAICYLNNGDRKKAENEFSMLQNEIVKKKISEAWKYEVEYWLIFLDEKNNPKQALQDYNALNKKVADSYPDVANKAELRIGRVLIEQKNYSEALSYFSDIINGRLTADREVVAGAYLGRGICTIRNGRPNPEDYKRALFDLLRVIVHYEDIGDHQAEAMYFAGKCFQQLGGKDATKRWQTLYHRLNDEWGNTLWGKEAAKEISG